jgi:hypothetical protein
MNPGIINMRGDHGLAKAPGILKGKVRGGVRVGGPVEANHDGSGTILSFPRNHGG